MALPAVPVPEKVFAEEFIEGVIEHPYMFGSPIWKEGCKLLNKDEDE